MAGLPQYEVVDGYGKVWFTGSLTACGTWIDPVLGIDFDHTAWGEPGIDEDRIVRHDDGTFTIEMYENAGELYVRPKESA